MHPKSKDRSGNAKLIADAKRALRDAKAGPGGQAVRRSKYGAKLAALRKRRFRRSEDVDDQ